MVAVSTYTIQDTVYKQQMETSVRNVSTQLAHFLEGDGQDFLNLAHYYKDHAEDMRIEYEGNYSLKIPDWEPRKELFDSEYQKKYGTKVLNFLKRVNDTYGHDKGNVMIRKCSRMVCDIFKHSPVFRIGGDEFVVILQGHDYEHIDDLRREMEQQMNEWAKDDSLKNWEKVSAAFGYASYDPEQDNNADSVFKRADKAMYHNKKEMKAVRTE